MGLQIGQNPASSGAVRLPRTREPEPVRAAPDTPQSAPSRREAVATETVSGPAAALETIGRTVRGVREFTPTLQETSVELRGRLAERRVETQRRIEEIGRRIESRIPEPSVQVRNFVNQANDTAGSVEARTGGEEALQVEGPSVEVERERAPVEPAQVETRAPVDREPAPVESAQVETRAPVDRERAPVEPAQAETRAPVEREEDPPPRIDIRV